MSGKSLNHRVGQRPLGTGQVLRAESPGERPAASRSQERESLSRSTEHQGDDRHQRPALLQTCVRMGPTRDKKHQPLSGKRNVSLEESHRWAPSLRLTAESLRPCRRGPPGYLRETGSQAPRTQPAPGMASACSRAAGPQGCAGPTASQQPHRDPELGPWMQQLRPPPPRVKSTKATDPFALSFSRSWSA